MYWVTIFHTFVAVSRSIPYGVNKQHIYIPNVLCHYPNGLSGCDATFPGGTAKVSKASRLTSLAAAHPRASRDGWLPISGASRFTQSPNRRLSSNSPGPSNRVKRDASPTCWLVPKVSEASRLTLFGCRASPEQAGTARQPVSGASHFTQNPKRRLSFNSPGPSNRVKRDASPTCWLVPKVSEASRLTLFGCRASPEQAGTARQPVSGASHFTQNPKRRLSFNSPGPSNRVKRDASPTCWLVPKVSEASRLTLFGCRASPEQAGTARQPVSGASHFTQNPKRRLSFNSPGPSNRVKRDASPTCWLVPKVSEASRLTLFGCRASPEQAGTARLPVSGASHFTQSSNRRLSSNSPGPSNRVKRDASPTCWLVPKVSEASRLTLFGCRGSPEQAGTARQPVSGASHFTQNPNPKFRHLWLAAGI